MTATALPDWGHPLSTPAGEVRVPAYAFDRLRMLGLLVNNKARLSPLAYRFIRPQYDCITMGLRHLLGEDLSGPAWCVCHCRECREREAAADYTLTPRMQAIERRVQADAAVKAVRARRRLRSDYGDNQNHQIPHIEIGHVNADCA